MSENETCDEKDREPEHDLKPPSSSDRDPLGPILESFLARFRKGERPSLTEYIARYPSLADEIREVLPALVEIEQLGSLGGAVAEAGTPLAAGEPRPALGNRSATEAVKPRGQPVTAALAADGTLLPERLGDYRIVRCIGEGGMGVVYEAIRESLHSRVALKVMHPRYRGTAGYLRRFRTEASSAAQLHHTNIVSVFDYGVHDGVCYYAMQYIAGHSLDEILVDVRRLRSNQGPVQPAPVERRLAAIARGEPASRKADGGAADMDATPAADPLVRAVAQGLLTGQFAVGAGATLDRDATTPPPTDPISPDMNERSAATHDLGFEFGGARPSVNPAAGSGDPRPAQRAGSEDPRPVRRALSDKDGNATDSAAGLSTSGLASSGGDRYHREVARLGAQVADALAHAHKRGVLHRDIKPSNLLLDAVGNVWVTDFGLAKFEEGEDLSRSQDVVGTLRYMAPERFRGVSDRRCDLYALGATLYELLTLRPAFESQDRLRLIDQIVHEPTAPPRQLDRRIPRDLETIVLKTLAKDPKDRFASADELGAELRRFLENRPIRSRPIPFYEQFSRWCKRNPKLAAANIAAAVLTTVLAIVSTVSAVTYRQQRNQIGKHLITITASEAGERRAKMEAREELFEALLDRARAGRFSHRVGQRFKSLAALRQAVAIGQELKLLSEQSDTLRDEAIACMALPDLEPAGRVMTQPSNAIAFAHDSTMTRYAFRFRDGTISVRRYADDQEIAGFQARADPEGFVFGFSPDGRYLATSRAPDHAVTVWDIERNGIAVNVPGPVHLFNAEFSPDSRRIAVESAYKILAYELATGQPLRRWSQPMPDGSPIFRPDGTEIAVVCGDQKDRACRILDAETGRILRNIPLPTANINLAWSPDGTTLAIAGNDNRIFLRDAATGIPKATLEGHTNSGWRATFHPAGTLLASTSWEARTWLWDPVLGRHWLNLTGGFSSGFSQDGRIIIAVGDKLTAFQVDPALEYRTFAHASRERMDYQRPSIRHDGRLLAVGTDRGAMLWDLARGTELNFLPIGLAWHSMFEPSGDLLTSGSLGVWRWPIQLDLDGRVFRIGPPHRLELPSSACQIAEDRSSQIVALADHNLAFVATPEGTIPVGPLEDCRGVSVSPDGEWLATGNHNGKGAQVWRIRDATKAAELPVDYGGGVIFSPDGKQLMTTGPPCRLWEVGTWREARQKIGGSARCFSPDGRLVVTMDSNRVLGLVETETGRTLARLESPDLCAVQFATFSPDGSRLVVTTNDGPAVHVWDLRAIRKNLSKMGLDWDAPAYPADDPASPSAPELPPLQVERDPLAQGRAHANRGLWEQAGVVYARAAVDGVLNRAELWFEQAVLRLAVGDAAGYRASCQHMFEALRRTDEPGWLEYAAHACALAPEGPAELAEAQQLAENRASVMPSTWSDHVLALALYRAGRFTEADTLVRGSLDRSPGWICEVLNWLVLAMADQRLGRTDDARRWLDRAESWVAQRLPGRPGGADRAIPKNWHWRDGILLHLLLHEARAVICEGLSELPADVFGDRY
jgi:serine/threonine protein kinase/WD40 repeat protein